MGINSRDSRDNNSDCSKEFIPIYQKVLRLEIVYFLILILVLACRWVRLQIPSVFITILVLVGIIIGLYSFFKMRCPKCRSFLFLMLPIGIEPSIFDILSLKYCRRCGAKLIKEKLREESSKINKYKKLFLITMWLSFLIMFWFLFKRVPTYMDKFVSLDVPLPYLVSLIFLMSNFTRHYFFVILPLLVICNFSLESYLKNKKKLMVPYLILTIIFLIILFGSKIMFYNLLQMLRKIQ